MWLSCILTNLIYIVNLFETDVVAFMNAFLIGMLSDKLDVQSDSVKSYASLSCNIFYQE